MPSASARTTKHHTIDSARKKSQPVQPRRKTRRTPHHTSQHKPGTYRTISAVSLSSTRLPPAVSPRERERAKDRQTERQRETHTDSQRERERETETYRQSERERESARSGLSAYLRANESAAELASSSSSSRPATSAREPKAAAAAACQCPLSQCGVASIYTATIDRRESVYTDETKSA
jgi:hypothetical protein